MDALTTSTIDRNRATLTAVVSCLEREGFDVRIKCFSGNWRAEIWKHGEEKPFEFFEGVSMLEAVLKLLKAYVPGFQA